MIAGIGVDIVRVSRLANSLSRFGDRFAVKVLSQAEMPRFVSATNQAAWLAKRFAAKEAVAKALGTGMRGGVHFRQITVARKKSGAPCIELTGAARTRADKLGAAAVHISISDEAEYAVALAILETGQT